MNARMCGLSHLILASLTFSIGYSAEANSPSKREVTCDVEEQRVCALSPDGKLIAIGGEAYRDEDRPVAVVEVATNRVVGTLSGLSGRVAALEFMPDGASVIVGAEDGSLRIWNLKQPEKTIELLHGRGGRGKHTLDRVISLASRSDGKVLAESRVRKNVVLWDIEKRKEIGSIEIRGLYATGLSFSSDGKQLVVAGDEEHTPAIWKIQPLERTGILLGHEKGPLFATYCNGGKFIATAGPRDRTLRIWKANSDLTSEVALAARVDVLAGCANSNLVALTMDNAETSLYAIPEGRKDRVLLDISNGMQVFDLAYSSDGNHLAAVGPVKKSKTKAIVFALSRPRQE